MRGESEHPKASVCPAPSGSAEEPRRGAADALFPAAYTFSSSVYTPAIYGRRHDRLVSATSTHAPPSRPESFATAATFKQQQLQTM